VATALGSFGLTVRSVRETPSVRSASWKLPNCRRLVWLVLRLSQRAVGPVYVVPSRFGQLTTAAIHGYPIANGHHDYPIANGHRDCPIANAHRDCPTANVGPSWRHRSRSQDRGWLRRWLEQLTSLTFRRR
jgi:hypothetical protein